MKGTARWTATLAAAGAAFAILVVEIAWSAPWVRAFSALASVAALVCVAFLVWHERRRQLHEYEASEPEQPLATGEAPTAETLDDVDRVRFEQLVDEAVADLPPYLGEHVSNVQVVVEDEPPPGESLLGLYRGVPLTFRGRSYAGVAPDKITIYRGPIERLAGGDPEALAREVHHVVLHEIAHHFGISDARLVEIDRY